MRLVQKLDKVLVWFLTVSSNALFWWRLYLAATRGDHLDLLFVGIAFVVSGVWFLTACLIAYKKRPSQTFLVAAIVSLIPVFSLVAIYLYFMLITASI